MSSPALALAIDRVSAEERDRLVALLADFELVAIQEDDVTAPRVWTAHFGSAASRESAAAAIESDATFAVLAVQPLEVEDDDWARRTQADLPAIQVGRVIVAPPWDLPTPHPSSPTPVLVVIEPSRGFGTGHHQSTRLCLVLLQNREVRGRTMIDIGTGSGVLAITAAKLGAAYVAAVDVDPDAVENARENIATNAVAGIVEAHVEDFTTSARPPADVVTANLTGSLLSRHADDLVRFVRPDGVLIVSGFNVEERRMVEEALAPSFAVTDAAEEDGWYAFVLRPDRGQR